MKRYHFKPDEGKYPGEDYSEMVEDVNGEYVLYEDVFPKNMNSLETLKKIENIREELRLLETELTKKYTPVIAAYFEAFELRGHGFDYAKGSRYFYIEHHGRSHFSVIDKEYDEVVMNFQIPVEWWDMSKEEYLAEIDKHFTKIEAEIVAKKEEEYKKKVAEAEKKDRELYLRLKEKFEKRVDTSVEK